MREELLAIIEKNSRIDLKELAVILGVEEIDVVNELAALEAEGIICGYHTLINWEKTDIEKVSALIEVRVTPQRGQGFDSIAERIYKYPEVRSVYLMSGAYDLMVILEGKTLREVSNFVSDKLSTLDSVLSTAISLGVGEPDFDTPWHIRDEGIYSLEKGRTFYTSNAGLKDLRQEICNTIRRKQGVSYDWQHEVLVTVGGSEAIDIGLRAMCNPGDEVLIPQPSYVSYEPCAILAGATPVIIDLKAENEFRLTAEELEAAITDKTKVLILPFPNNPTGAIMEKSDLEAIAKIIEEHDIFVMSDEIYSELNYKEKHVSIISLPGMKERTVYINGFSKAYAMTGWRLGYCCGPAAIIQQMTKIHQFAIMCAPTTSQKKAMQTMKN